MAHSSSIRARYGDWLVPDLKAAIECIRNPLLLPGKLAPGEPLDRESNPLPEAAE